MLRRNLSKWILSALLLLLFLGAQAHAAESKGEVLATIVKLYPQLPVVSVKPGPAPGLYEVLLKDDEIVYFLPESGHLLVGNLWSPQNQNLTSDRIQGLRAERIKGLPLDQAIKVGSGKNIVIVVTDPDCPYCRKGDAFLAGRSDVTSYIFFMPLAIHPQAAQKAAYVLSSSDPARAYGEVMSGLWDTRPIPPFKDNGKLEIHRQIAEKLGVKGTPAFWVNGNFVSGANIDKLKGFLGDSLPQPKP